MSTVRSNDGTTIAYDRHGAGPPVILVGGAFQHRAFDPSTVRLAELLAAAGLGVFHYDRRGRGESGDTAPYAVERELEDLDAMIDAAGAPRLSMARRRAATSRSRAPCAGRRSPTWRCGSPTIWSTTAVRRCPTTTLHTSTSWSPHVGEPMRSSTS